ncbi:hypothetical protein Q5H93_14910 [Hymenobacter sp. ASUV-10]|uniref:Uncharacterized protein n=1 Tax=Hymenobacter aranciens TaxID=3063996 RepID=A0ABT9BCV4_9BACT|nr:hypothetical protein [Hymenobacter sp. ASUV-10]MDO7876032.1 hypothetical protein [Hymenobacter sp. ASUV-10]
MYDLPAQLSDDAVQALRSNLRRVIELRDEIKEMPKPTGRGAYQPSDYLNQVRDRLRAVYHGERDRFYVPHTDAIMALQHLEELGTPKINSSFSTSKTKLLSILNRYIKGLQRGFAEHEKETGSVPPA